MRSSSDAGPGARRRIVTECSRLRVGEPCASLSRDSENERNHGERRQPHKRCCCRRHWQRDRRTLAIIPLDLDGFLFDQKCCEFDWAADMRGATHGQVRRRGHRREGVRRAACASCEGSTRRRPGAAEAGRRRGCRGSLTHSRKRRIVSSGSWVVQDAASIFLHPCPSPATSRPRCCPPSCWSAVA